MMCVCVKYMCLIEHLKEGRIVEKKHLGKYPELQTKNLKVLNLGEYMII